MRGLTRWPVWLPAAILLAGCSGRSHADQPVLVLERTIALPGTKGRIDHLAVDIKHHRLFIAELGNGTVDSVDLDAGKVMHRIEGLREPQGLAYLPDSDEIVVSTGGDGQVRFYDAGGLFLKATLTDLPDADNIRVSPKDGTIVVGYGGGALALIDGTTHAVKGSVRLPSHPEGFQVSPDGRTVLVNLPRSAAIAVVDLAAGKQMASWPVHQAFENFPMSVDWPSATVAAGFRLPARFMTFDANTGRLVSNLPACGTTDDLFYDGRRQRFYMLCGDGHVDIFGRAHTGWVRAGRMDTASGGRTGIFSPELDRLYVVSSGGGAARLSVWRPR